MNKPPKKSAPKPKRFKLPDGTGLVVWRTDYSAPLPKVKQAVSPSPEGKADEIGRLAGHTAGTWASKIREKSREFKQS